MHTINSVPAATTLHRLEIGKAMFSARTLSRYVEEELRLFETLCPDLVVGDMRPSLSISARVRRITYLAVGNAYWSPYSGGGLEMPENVLSLRLGCTLAKMAFPLLLPMIARLHCRTVNMLRQSYGLPRIRTDIRAIMNDADHLLFADDPAIAPVQELPANHHYLGMLNWSYPISLPKWWSELPLDRPIVYASVGSSGSLRMLPKVLAALATLRVTVIATTAGRLHLSEVPENAYVCHFLPHNSALERSRLFITHGGSCAAYGALVKGVPVLGIPSNMDQHLCMRNIERAQVGLRIRSERASVQRILEAARRLLEDRAFRANAAALAPRLQTLSPADRFQAALEHALDDRTNLEVEVRRSRRARARLANDSVHVRKAG